jgi:hypothetical protein
MGNGQIKNLKMFHDVTKWIILDENKYNVLEKELWFHKTRGSVGWACVAHLSFCFEET